MENGIQYTKPSRKEVSNLKPEALVTVPEIKDIFKAFKVRAQLQKKIEEIDAMAKELLRNTWKEVCSLDWDHESAEEGILFIMSHYLLDDDLQILEIESLPNYLEEFFDMRPPKNDHETKLYRDFWEKVDAELAHFAEHSKGHSKGWRIIRQMDDAALELLNGLEPVFEEFYLGKDVLIYKLRSKCSEDSMM